jgi:hypothetical protein
MHPAWLTLSTNATIFGESETEKTFTIRRLGWYGNNATPWNKPDWTNTTEAPWIVSLSPDHGDTGTETDTITVRIDRNQVPCGAAGQIVVTPLHYGRPQTISVTVSPPATVSLSGRVTEGGWNGLGGVPVYANDPTGGYIGSASTDWDGSYTLSVPYRASGMLYVGTVPGMYFPIPSLSFNNLLCDQGGMDFVAWPDTHFLSGYVRTVLGEPVPDATVLGFPGSPITTDWGGYYSTFVNYGWSGVASPTKDGFQFVPRSRTYDYVTADLSGQDYTALPATYAVAGRVRTADGTGIGGVMLVGLPDFPKTGMEGGYSNAVPFGWAGTVIPTKAGYSFLPSRRD